MSTIPHHDNLLLDDLDVIPLLQLYHLYGGQFIALDDLCLETERSGDEKRMN